MRSPRAAAWLALLALAFCVQRLRTYDEPFERDIMTYAVIGHELVLGNRLYSDILDIKPPAIYAAFGLAERLVGYGPAEVYLVNVVFGLLAMGGLYRAAVHALGLEQTSGLTSALLWLLFSYDLTLHGNQPNTELCLNALVVLAFAFAFGAGGRRRHWAAGSLLALASLFKPVALVMVPLWIAARLIQDAPGPGRVRRAVAHAAALGLPAVLAWLAALAYFWWDDRLDIFTTVMWEFNRDYAGDLGDNLATAFSPARLWPASVIGALPLLGLTVAGAVVGVVRDHRRWLPLLAYSAGAVAMVALPGRWWDHYYQLYLPPLALGATLGLWELGRQRAPWGVRVRSAALLAAFGIGLGVHLFQLRLDGDQASFHKYRDRFLAVREAARRASDLMRDGETLYMYGIEPGVYFHTRRRPVVQALWLNHLTGPLRVPLRHALRRQLRAARPDLIVRDTRYRTNWFPPGLAEWMAEQYEPLPAAPGMAPFQLLVRRDSALRGRVAGLL